MPGIGNDRKHMVFKGFSTVKFRAFLAAGNTGKHNVFEGFSTVPGRALLATGNVVKTQRFQMVSNCARWQQDMLVLDWDFWQALEHNVFQWFLMVPG